MHSTTATLDGRMADALQYENPRVLKRYMLDHHVSEDEAELRFGGMKQFLVVCATTPGYKVTSDKIDSMWHTFLLFTREYRQFCSDYFGKFIHHEPFETPSPESYLTTRARAHELFGELDDTLWPEDAKIDCSSGCGE